MATRRSELDICKGIAIICVVLGHVVTSYRNSGLLTEATLFNFACTFVYSFHMPLFFLISGYLSTMSRSGGFKEDIGKKVISYGIPYLIFSIVDFAMKFLLAGVVNNKVSWVELLGVPLYPIGALWFIYALLFVSLLHICMNAWVVDARRRCVIECSLAAALKLVSCFTLPTWLRNSVFVDMAGYYIWFCIGVYLAPMLIEMADSIRLKPIHKGVVLPSCAVVFGVALFFCDTYNTVLPEALMVLPFNVVGVVLLFLIAKGIGRSKWLEALGKNSFPIYLLHGYVISAGRVVFSKFRVPLLQGILPLIVFTILGVLLPYIAYVVASKVKYLDFCFYPAKYMAKAKK